MQSEVELFDGSKLDMNEAQSRLIDPVIRQYRSKFTAPEIACLFGPYRGGICFMRLYDDVYVHIHLDHDFQPRKIHVGYKEDEAWFEPKTNRKGGE